MGTFNDRWAAVFVLGAVTLGGCGKEQPDPVAMDPAASAGAMAEAGGGAPSTTAGAGGADAPAASAGSSAAGTSGGMPAEGGSGGSEENTVPPAVMEMLDPDVDWTALTLVYAPLYSAFDGEHVFQVPVHVDGATVELGDWQAIPSTAVTIDPDPEGGGVMLTIVEPVEEITIAAQSGMIGGTAQLHVTLATPEDWMIGDARYHNGVDYDLPMLDFAQIIDPNWMPPTPPPNLACNNCHTTGAKYFEIQHTPTQISLYSDEDLIGIFTTGMKPSFARWVFLPEQFQDLYVDFHRWESTPEEQKGLIVYLRSLTPTGQGDFVIPDITGLPMMP